MTTQRLPAWFKIHPSQSGHFFKVKALLRELELHTVCEDAHCPNMGECFSRQTATFLIMGNACTRRCRFCAVGKGIPEPLDAHEPVHLSRAVGQLGLKYVVITSVTRDDLPDGGAKHFADVIESLKSDVPQIKIEVLVPDFKGNDDSVMTVVGAGPQVFAHNLETVPRLYADVRPGADYRISLNLLRRAKQADPGIVTKSALMLGMGETRAEVLDVMQDLIAAGCELLTLGQYLAPSSRHYPVASFITPEEFDEYVPLAKTMGFKGIASAPLVRSSYQAAELFQSSAI